MLYGGPDVLDIMVPIFHIDIRYPGRLPSLLGRKDLGPRDASEWLPPPSPPVNVRQGPWMLKKQHRRSFVWMA